MLISTSGPVSKSIQATAAMTTRLAEAILQRGARRSAVFSLASSMAGPRGGWAEGDRERPAAARAWGEDKRPGTGSAREARPSTPPPCNVLRGGPVSISDSVNQMRPMPAHLGELEQLVLLALLRLGDAAYGVTVRATLEQRAHRRLSLGTVYKTLLRLETKGFVAAWVGEPTPERGGRRKKHYRVTGAGRRALGRSLDALRKLGRGLDPAWQAP